MSIYLWHTTHTTDKPSIHQWVLNIYIAQGKEVYIDTHTPTCQASKRSGDKIEQYLSESRYTKIDSWREERLD